MYILYHIISYYIVRVRFKNQATEGGTSPALSVTFWWS